MTKLSAYRPQRKNANRHRPLGMKHLADGIGKYGVADGITVAADGESISGSARIETLADIMPDVTIVEVETHGKTLLVNKRMDIPNADDPKAQELSAVANIAPRNNYDADGELLAALANAADDDILKRMIEADEMSLDAVLGFSQQAQSGDFEEISKSKIDNEIPEMELQLGESYDYIVLVFKSQLDFLQMVDLLKIKKSAVTIRDDLRKFGVGRCINGERALSLMRHG